MPTVVLLDLLSTSPAHSGRVYNHRLVHGIKVPTPTARVAEVLVAGLPFSSARTQMKV
ncbi:hypothetical protein DPMN_003953 [Dreissena polymorpha]|uniref:Uncharacterized protein n=1 Tax=Dreissena polymorpha TaxID=45954 RepID=A0A9D4MPE3_DREPO|nr:hypothetical protein DPMN_003953 [Dreissena polymorpha]